MSGHISKTKPYFIISVDYEGCLGYYSEDNCNYGCDDDTLELEGYEDTPFIVNGLEKWCYEWNDVMLLTSAGKQVDFNWDDWERRGLDLAQRLRQIMPEQISLYFHKNGEDILIEKLDYMFLSPDTSFIVGDTNIGVVTYLDDEVEIGDFLPITLPGLDKWWQAFDSHVDYADSYADPDFDWASWTEMGFELSRILRARLPESVEVWYRSPFECRNVFPIKDLLLKPDGTFLIRDFLSHKSSKGSTNP